MICAVWCFGAAMLTHAQLLQALFVAKILGVPLKERYLSALYKWANRLMVILCYSAAVCVASLHREFHSQCNSGFCSHVLVATVFMWVTWAMFAFGSFAHETSFVD